MKSIVLILAATICLAQSGVSIRGRVVNAVTAQPLRSLPVVIYGEGGNLTVLSDANGNFAANNLPPGLTRISCQSKHFPALLGVDLSAVSLDLKAGAQISDLVLKLSPPGTISGTVSNDRKEPVQNCAVMAVPKSSMRTYLRHAWNREATTDDRGRYRILGLSADRYFVAVECNESLPVRRPLSQDWAEPRESWLPVFYPDSPERSAAAALRLMPGAEISGIDFALRRTAVGSLHGTLQPAARPDLLLLEVIPTGSQSNADFAPPEQYIQPGSATFDIQYILPGTYTLRATVTDNDSRVFSYSSADVNIDSKQTEQVVLATKPALTLHGQFVASADMNATGSPPQETSIVLEQKASDQSFARSANVAEDGSFTLTGLLPGTWTASINSRDKQSVEAIVLGAHASEGSEIEIRECEVGPLKIVAARAVGGTVTVTLEEATPQGPTRVLIYPVLRGAIDPARTLSHLVVSNGSAQLPSLAPGEYFAFAVNDGVRNTRPIANILAARAETFSFQEGASQTIKIRALSTDDILQLALEYLQNPTDPF